MGQQYSKLSKLIRAAIHYSYQAECQHWNIESILSFTSQSKSKNYKPWWQNHAKWKTIRNCIVSFADNWSSLYLTGQLSVIIFLSKTRYILLWSYVSDNEEWGFGCCLCHNKEGWTNISTVRSQVSIFHSFNYLGHGF